MPVSPKELYDRFNKMAVESAHAAIFEDPAFEHMTIKVAKEYADIRSSAMMRFAIDYHNSMSMAEKEEEKIRAAKAYGSDMK